ncbi:twin-arginine translocase TatA/TatE family subunit [Peribacillus sp. NPDC096540]|uniref:twin-arginine translocase TatA/TatE family subunit n=1 Tax=Peribacillus sp. NPDC096540 TaxID=3390612 RepID=UPI003CFEC69D
MVSPGGLVLIGAVALIVFGPKKLPEVGRAVGKSLVEFKNATRGIIEDDNVKEKKERSLEEIKSEETKLK